ncbi:PID-CTERM protein-sorting domain-containing protein [Polaribacter sp. Asnod1-A03]|uniref:PID-CTERM protein-sorting domain-containing protein n=1 Tax=Polaribacter sp. Asnod1-A03 TaxID=3160581 RepID=UPI00386FEEF9
MKKIKYFILVLVTCTSFNNLYGQKTPPPPEAKDVTPPPGLPIDAGLTILALSAIVYGVRKTKN